MEVKSFGKINVDTLYAPINQGVRLYPLCLYDKFKFIGELATKKYVCVYTEQWQFIPTDAPNKTADVIFERTIDPNLDSKIYVCIKLGDEMREDLRED